MKINLLQKSLMDFKTEFVNRFNSFLGRFNTYADIFKNKPVEIKPGFPKLIYKIAPFSEIKKKSPP